MKIPPGFLDTNGKTAKGDFVLTKGEDQTELLEFGATSEDNKISCYVLTSPGDILALRFALNANIADHADFVIDGVLRNCHSNILSKSFKGAFEKAIYQRRKSNGKQAGVKYSKMKVKERGTVNAIALTNSNTPSSVGSLELRLYRTDPRSSKEATASDDEAQIAERTDRAPTFDRCAEWYDGNSNVDFEGTPPPFQIEFIDHKDANKAVKDRVLKDLPTTCKLWATFIFHLRSTADLRCLGFDCPIYYLTPAPPPPPDPNLLAESNPFTAGVVRQDTVSTEFGSSLAEEFTEGTPTNQLEGTEVQKIKAPPKTVPVTAPPTTLTGLLSRMSNASKDKYLFTRANSGDGFIRGGVAPTTDLSSLAGAPGPIARYHSNQDFGFFKSGEGVQRVPVVQPSEPATAANAFKNSKDAVQPKEEPVDDYSTRRESLERHHIIVLSGVGGPGTSPAHQAFLQRPATQESDTRPATPMPDDPFRAGGDNFSHGIFSSQQSTPNVVSPRRRVLSQPPELLASIEGGKFSHSGSPGAVLGSTCKPLTPPVAWLERHPVPRGSTGLDDVWGRSRIKPSGSTTDEPALPVNSQDHKSSLDFQIPETIQELPSHPDLQNGSFIFAKPAIPGLHTQQEPFETQIDCSRAPSEPPSETETEIADPEDIIRAVRASQKSIQSTNNTQVSPSPEGSSMSPRFPESGRFPQDSSWPNPSLKSESLEDIGNHTHSSPILGAMPSSSPKSTLGSSQLLMSQGGVGSPSGIPTQQVWRNFHSPTPSSPSPSSSTTIKQKSTPQNPAQEITQVQPSPSPGNPLPNEKPATPTAARPKTVEKRKVELITGKLEGSPSPSKTTISPASRKFENVEAERLAAEARVATAQKKKEELQKKLETAEALVEQRKKIHDLNEQAAEVERENAAIEAKIASLYGVGEET
ncbi:hypothetical protein BKA65DRAFT_596500 [Rhexocercosporidium sp. MPI-PUGE-AT-0058]|nr:hypothetical protein BKA65DRAFT_596500 [Rhexocercosporidium sp. MPI-PUGE-AT-0058]